MSGDPKQECFSDSITEEIITGLSKMPQLFVIGRNSSFAFNGKAVSLQEVDKKLVVRYVLEGSVCKGKTGSGSRPSSLMLKPEDTSSQNDTTEI